MAYIPPNPNGNTTAANSAPVTLASDNNGPVKLSDGTNTANILKSDGTAAGQNAQLVAAGYLSVPFTTTTVQAVGSTDAGNYKWVSVQITSQGTNSTVNFQGSNDNSTWISAGLLSAASTGGSATSINTTAAAMLVGPVNYRYFRLNVTGISAGTTAGTIIFFTQSAGSVTTSSALSGFKTNNNAAPGATNIGALTGIANAAQQSWTEGNEVLTSMDLKGNQRMRISDAAGNDRGANVNSSNQLQVNGPVSTISATVAVGQTTSNTSAVQLSGSSTPSTNGILVQALAANTANVYIGGSGVTTGTGYQLQAGQAVPFTVSDITSLYVIGSNGTDGVCWNVM